jgi:hypothetical protein
VTVEVQSSQRGVIDQRTVVNLHTLRHILAYGSSINRIHGRRVRVS